jgi:small subunit ribosomal protein S18
MAPRTERPTRRRATSAAPRAAHKPCALCRDEVEWVDYKNIVLLRRYMSDRGRIRSRQATGNCARHQGEVAVAIKTARELVLLPRGATENSADGGAHGHREKTTTSKPLETAGATGGGRS